jgi:hypothetical protein
MALIGGHAALVAVALVLNSPIGTLLNDRTGLARCYRFGVVIARRWIGEEQVYVHTLAFGLVNPLFPLACMNGDKQVTSPLGSRFLKRFANERALG